MRQIFQTIISLKICINLMVHYICKYKRTSMNLSESILDLLKKDENKAFRLLFDRYYDNLLLYCYHILDDLEAAEDIVQDCFTNLWNSKRLYSFTGNLDRFIFKIVKNRSLLFLKEYKKRNEVQTSFFMEENDSFHNDFTEEYQNAIELLYNTIDRLPEKCRKVFLMACLNDKTYQEIADELGTSVNTIKTQMKTALKFLRENLQEKYFLTILLFLTKKL